MVFSYGATRIKLIYIDKILKLSKWAIRTVTKSHYRSHTGPLFLKYNALNVFDMYHLNLGIFMYKHRNNIIIVTS